MCPSCVSDLSLTLTNQLTSSGLFQSAQLLVYNGRVEQKCFFGFFFVMFDGQFDTLSLFPVPCSINAHEIQQGIQFK